ncbi:hypothetical protein Belba_2893 [Belliella baltica DSM 15883]|uniref:Uncharacterized protein n=1 Tax=Belliella baltica (strain DSM 15883 / CIP 108006 / LMG 21964 / BA134) TaxID=866536 RepID=I3Z856_BELBD|nr:hypothetical protein [Belliella baltica]AFL85424.1 hypothetical protein Belba_2893 [Belliella baltica DSM 15883]
MQQIITNKTGKLSDYKIDIPKVVFYELAEEQTVTLSVNLKK